MSQQTLAWWMFLCAASLINLVAWTASASALNRCSSSLHPQAWAHGRLQLMLSAGYVLGCAYRSVLPVFDVQRLCLVDSWWSSVIVGRSVATVAELCFAAQWAVMLRRVGQAHGSAMAVKTASLILPMIALAELFSWNAVLTTSNLGHVVEESLWGLAAALIVASMVSLAQRADPAARRLFLACAWVGAAYVAYMLWVDVPMYWNRWVADEALGRPYHSLVQGARDASTRWVVSHRWEDWKSEVIWMSLYFSVAVWLSIGMVHAAVRSRPQLAT